MIDLRAAIANAIKMAPESTPGDRYEQIADAVLAVPGLRQAWERSQAIDAEPFRCDYYEQSMTRRAEPYEPRSDCNLCAHDALLSRLRAVGVSKEPT